MKVTFSKQALSAVARFSAKQDIRYYLNGVLVEVGKTESRLVGTNGHALAAYRVQSGSGDDGARYFIIPSPVVAMFKPKKREAYPQLTLEVLDDFKGTLSDGSGLSMAFEFVEGRFPDYRNVFP